MQTSYFQSKVRNYVSTKTTLKTKYWSSLGQIFILVHGPKALYKNHNLAKDTEAYEDNIEHLVMHLLLFKSCYAAVLDIYANVVKV